MEKTHYQKTIETLADALLFAESTSEFLNQNLPRHSLYDNPQVIGNALSLCIRRIKEIDKTGEVDEKRNMYVDVFWYIAEKHKMTKNSDNNDTF